LKRTHPGFKFINTTGLEDIKSHDVNELDLVNRMIQQDTIVGNIQEKETVNGELTAKNSGSKGESDTDELSVDSDHGDASVNDNLSPSRLSVEEMIAEASDQVHEKQEDYNSGGDTGGFEFELIHIIIIICIIAATICGVVWYKYATKEMEVGLQEIDPQESDGGFLNSAEKDILKQSQSYE
jgi:hypothetical protein